MYIFTKEIGYILVRYLEAYNKYINNVLATGGKNGNER